MLELPVPTPIAPAQPAPIAVVDVVAQLEKLAAAYPQKLNWRVSIADLLRLLGIDNSLAARKEMARELGCPEELIGGDYSQDEHVAAQDRAGAYRRQRRQRAQGAPGLSTPGAFPGAWRPGARTRLERWTAMPRSILVSLLLASLIAAAPGLEGRERVPPLTYQVHVSERGWLGWVRGGAVAGAPERGRQVEAVKLRMERAAGRIRYSVHVRGVGWTDWAADGQIAGTTGQKRRVEAIRVELDGLPGWSVAYRVYLRGQGWSEWARDGEPAGTTGQSLPVDAIQVQIEPRPRLQPALRYQVHRAERGWEDWRSDGETAGDPRGGTRVEAVRIELEGVRDARLRVQAHVQRLGWQPWVGPGEVAGTTGESRRLEAIRIELDGVPGASIRYRVFMRDRGWSEWAADGDVAGTTGEGQAIEAIEIRIEPRDIDSDTKHRL